MRLATGPSGLRRFHSGFLRGFVIAILCACSLLRRCHLRRRVTTVFVTQAGPPSAPGKTPPSVGDDSSQGDGQATRPGDPDAEILAGLRGRNPACFERLVRRYGGLFLSLARRYLSSPADAADVVQESFLAVYEGIDRFAGESRLQTWMHRIVINKCLMRLRNQRRHNEVDIDEFLPSFLPDGHQAQPTQPWRDSAEVELQKRHTQAQVRQAIDKLPATYRTVLLLRDIDEIDSAEAALLLGINEGALRVRLHRARQALRGLLEPLFLDSPTPDDTPAGAGGRSPSCP